MSVYDFESVCVSFYERRVDDAVRKVNRLLELESVDVSGDVATLHDRLKRHIKAKLQCFTNSSWAFLLAKQSRFCFVSYKMCLSILQKILHHFAPISSPTMWDVAVVTATTASHRHNCTVRGHPIELLCNCFTYSRELPGPIISKTFQTKDASANFAFLQHRKNETKWSFK